MPLGLNAAKPWLTPDNVLCGQVFRRQSWVFMGLFAANVNGWRPYWLAALPE
jgi:hypothetical protein